MLVSRRVGACRISRGGTTSRAVCTLPAPRAASRPPRGPSSRTTGTPRRRWRPRARRGRRRPSAGWASARSASPRSASRFSPRLSQRPTRRPITSWAVRWGTPSLDQEFHQGRGVEEALVEPRGDPVGAEARAVDDHARRGRGRPRRCRRRRRGAPCLPAGRGCRPAAAP